MLIGLDVSFLWERVVLKRIALITVACGALGAAYALLAPKWYESVLTVMPARAQRGGASSLASAIGGDAGALAAGFLESSAGGADGPRIAAVLQSIAVSDAVIEKFDLRTRYGAKYQEAAREILWRRCVVKVMAKPGLVQLRCEDKDPRFVQQILSYFAEYGNQVFRRVGVSSASEEVRFLEKRVAELRQQADEAALRMRAFQEKHKIVDLDTQAKAVVQALAALNSQKISKQLEFDFARTFSSREEASLRQLESQLSVIGEKLRRLEEPPPQPEGPPAGRGAAGSGTSEMFPAALEVPRLRAEFETLYRDRRVAEMTLVFALERLEGARANEAREVSTFLVLDPPPLPTRHSRPRGSFSVMVGLILGGLVALAVEVLRRPETVSALRAIAARPHHVPVAPEGGPQAPADRVRGA